VQVALASLPFLQVQADPAVAATAQELADAAAAAAGLPPRVSSPVLSSSTAAGLDPPHWHSSRPGAALKLWLDFTGSNITGTGAQLLLLLVQCGSISAQNWGCSCYGCFLL
jgi:hypothetical protein